MLRNHFASAFVLGIFVLLAAGSSESDNSGSDPQSTSHEVVENSEWDGSVSQVESWLENNLKDPGSLEFIEWSPVQKTDDGGYMVRVKYRAKNSFGGYVVENQVFFLDSSGTVTNVMDW